MKSKKLDQFYTNPIISDELVEILMEKLPKEMNNSNFIEPSAGTGNFITSLKKAGIKQNKINAYDLDPKDSKIIKKNYLIFKQNFSKKKFIIGNPPFGKRGKLALLFLNKCLRESPYVAMIMPNIFNRYSIQKQINKNASLFFTKQLNEKSFILNDKEYGVKCVFQIWTNNKVDNNLRILNRPQIRHLDFQTWIHNNTKATLKYFDKEKYNWDFAIHRQGYYDYKLMIKDPKKLIKNRQYFFIKSKNKKILNLIEKINFEKLSKTNTQVYGFSTSDFVKEYKQMKGEK